MQRLRSPFRLRPGPGAEQRKGKVRRDQPQVGVGEATPEDVRSSPSAENTQRDTQGRPGAVPAQQGRAPDQGDPGSSDA